MQKGNERNMKNFFSIDYQENRYISGVINEPNNKKKAAVIMCYGMNGNRVCQHRIGVKLERELEKAEISLVRFDYENIGTSSGFFEASDIKQRIDNLEKVYCYIKEVLDYKKIYLLGFSDGARNVISLNQRIECDGIILWNPILGGNSENSGSNSMTKMIMHPLYKVAVKELLGVGMNVNMLIQLKGDNTINEIENISIKCIAIFGTADELSKEVRVYFEKIIKDNCTIVYINKADHLFNREQWEKKVILETSNWLRRHL